MNNKFIPIVLIIAIICGALSGFLSFKNEKASAYTPHSPININGNADFAAQAAIEGWPGDGSEMNPYIIENYDIDATSAFGIQIKNVDVHFVIRHCYIHGGWMDKHGIFFNTVKNGTVETTESNGNNYGIRLEFSSNNTISNCSIVSNYDDGIYLTLSSGNIIVNNTISNNGAGGIELDKSQMNTIFNNTFSNDGIHMYGTSLAHWNTHTVTDNFANGKPIYYYKNTNGITVPQDAISIILANCNDFTINGIDASNVDIGIQLAYSHNNIISNSNVYSHKWEGIYFTDSTNNIIYNTTVSYNWHGIHTCFSPSNTISNCYINLNNFNGIHLFMSSSNNINNNTIRLKSYSNEHTARGVLLWSFSNNNIIYNNTIFNGNDGVGVGSSSGNKIHNNTLYSHVDDGIHVYSNANANYIYNNSIYQNVDDGIQLESGSNNEVFNNTIHDNNWGMRIRPGSGNNLVYDNKIYSNAVDGIHLESSSNNEMFNNTIRDNIRGIQFTLNSDNNIITSNNINYNIEHCVYIADSNGNNIYHNNFIENNVGNGVQAFDNTNNGNQWDDGYPSGGNYWSDFDEPSEGAFDDYTGIDQNIPGGDGLVDNGSAAGGGKNPYVIDSDSRDVYPLITPGPPINIRPQATYLGVQDYLEGTSGIMHIIDHTPELNWTYKDMEGDPQIQYEVRVGSSRGASDMWSPGIQMGTTSRVTYAGNPLIDDWSYWFGVRVYDGEEWSAWSEVLFHMNTIYPPTTPIDPLDDTAIPVSSMQTVSWTSGGTDPEGDTVSYYWEVSENDPTFASGNIIASGGPTLGTTSTSFVTLYSTSYYWRVYANDTWESSIYGNTPTGYWMFMTYPNNFPEARHLGVQGYLETTAGIMNITDHTPDLNWTYYDADGAPQTQFEVMVGTAPFSSDMWAPGVQPGATTTLGYSGSPLIDGMDYWFSVRVYDGTDWSSFNQTQFHMNTIMDPTTPVDPIDGANIPASIDQIVSWTSGGLDPEGDSVIYHWEVSEGDSTFDPSNIIASGSTIDTFSTSFTTSPSTTYYWRVNATDSWEVSSYGNPSPGPGYWTFTTTANNAPEAQNIGIQGYLDGSSGILHIIDHTPNLNWTYYDINGDPQNQYEVRVGSSPGANDMWSPGVQMGALTSVGYDGAALDDNMNYWFGVRVYDGSDWSVWNETQFHMNTILTPTTPVTPPQAGTVLKSSTQMVSWSKGGVDPEGDTVTFYWEVATNTGFTSIITSGSTIGSTSSTFVTLASTTYYWRVYASDAWENSDYCNTLPGYWTFTTEDNTAPEARFLGVQSYLEGSNDIIHVQDHTPDLNWTYYDSDGDLQTHFEVRVGSSPGTSDMWSLSAQIGTSVTSTYSGTTLIDGTDYWFGVRVYDGIDWSAWSETQFHMNAILTPTTPINPSNDASIPSSSTQMVTWTPGGNDPENDIVTYHWEVTTDPGFTSIIASGSTTVTTSSTFVTSTSTTYYWRVYAEDGWETSPHGNTPPGYWMFSTSDPIIDLPPEIDAVAKPNPQKVGGDVNVSANITDDIEVYGVWIEIIDPDGISLGNVSMSNDSTINWYYYKRPYPINGTHTYIIWAVDTNNNWNSTSGTFEIVQEEAPPEPRSEFNWKPFIAILFSVILLLFGLLVSYKRPIMLRGILRQDRFYTFLGGVLPFILAEVATGIISLLTGYLSVPPILGIGMIVDPSILLAGLVSCYIIFKKGYKPTNQENGATHTHSNLPPPPKSWQS